MLRTLLRYKTAVSLLLGTLVLIHVLIEYFNGGITRHHLLARDDMPAISNAWGILSVSLLAYYTLHRIEIRFERNDASVYRGFALGLLLGLALALLWEIGWSDFMPFLLFAPLALALLWPVYRAECFLGFVLGMAYTFGGILPMLVGGLLCILAFVVYKGIRGGLLALLRRS